MPSCRTRCTDAMQHLLDALQRYTVAGRLRFRPSQSGLVFAEIDHPEGSATVCLQGAHVTTFRPKTQPEPVVWVSEAARYAPGKSIRGGVPVCWPWFGAHPTRADWPAHGFARTAPWSVVDSRADADATMLTLQLTASDATRALWPHDTPVTLRISVSEVLDIELTTHNASAQALPLGEALHTYFQIGDIAEVELTGLDGCSYLDKTEGFARKRQHGALRFAGETDRIYVGTRSACVIHDPRLLRRIRIDKQGSASTVVWTPWAEKAAAMGDFTAQGWRNMLCVESANAADDTLTLHPGETHTLRVRYSVEAM